MFGNARNRRIGAAAAALAAVTVTGVLPGAAYAQGYRHEAEHRQQTKNDWRNLAIAAGGVGALGLLSHDPTVAVLGGAGALYSLNRYEQDRKSQSDAARARAEIFSHPYFYRDGTRYDRHTVDRHGERYYQFVRH
jgi:hypothetical protein